MKRDHDASEAPGAADKGDVEAPPDRGGGGSPARREGGEERGTIDSTIDVDGDPPPVGGVGGGRSRRALERAEGGEGAETEAEPAEDVADALRRSEQGGGADDGGAGEPNASADVDGKGGRAGVVEVFRFGEGPRKSCGLALGLACAAVTGCVYPAMAFLLSATFRVLSAPAADGFLEGIRESAYRFVAVGAISFASVTAQVALLESAAEEMTCSLKTKWFDALIRQDMAFFDLQDVSSTAALLSSNGSTYKRGIGRKLGEGVQFAFTFLGGFAFAFYCSWRTSLVLLGVVPFMSASILLLAKTSLSQAKWSSEGYAEAGSVALTAASAIRTVYSLNASSLMIEKYANATEKAYQATASRVALLGLANAMVMGTVLFLRSAVLTLYGSFLLYNQVRTEGCDPSGALVELNVGCEPDGQRIFGALIGITIGAAGIPQISLAVEAFGNARAACYPAINVMGRKLESTASSMATDGPSKRVSCSTLAASLPKYEIDSSSKAGIPATSLRGEICFNNVGFSYPSRKSLVLNKFTVCLKPGQTVGVVGPSGSGKSTIVSLICRFYDAVSGSITIDDTDIKDYNVCSLRERIGLVNQEPKLFATSIRNNIAYGCPGASDEQIIEAAKLANAHDFINNFPSGYDTVVGEGGSQMSGGQRQRIALARVLVKKPCLLLLDEFSSSLDSESEMVVQEALDKILHERTDMTTLIVAHRLSTVRNADCILVVCDGTVVESGRHGELLAHKGLYHNLVQAQSTDHEAPATPPEFSSESSSDHQMQETQTDFLSPHIQFRNVHFHYPTRPDSKVLRGLNLAVRKGETLAVVGESGGGKSTIISLLQRFYDPCEGAIEFEGQDIRELNVRWFRDQIGLVSQEPVLFDTTIRENILYGSPSASENEVEEACRRANAHDFVKSFPLEYDTIVGEGGAQLSGGQKQRIAISRAIISKEHSVLLLDEASSSLDSESERLVQHALENIMTSKSLTTIVVAHRLSTVRNADRIAVVAGGVVQEIGSWDELMSRESGRFRRMSLMQSMNGSKDIFSIMAQVEAETEGEHPKEQILDQNREALTRESPQIKNSRMSNSKRARLLAREDLGLLAVGSVGAMLAGVGFPATGVLFGYLIELLYYPVPGCDSVDCSSIADEMQRTSFRITFAWICIAVCTSVGFVLLYYGFGTATEKMNKRVRDAAFKSLLRQEVAYFDIHNVTDISSQLQDDAAVLHAFSGEPLRTFITALSSLLIGIMVSFYFMWPLALIALGLVPFLIFAAKFKMTSSMGVTRNSLRTDESESQDSNPDTIAIETLLNMRTVASLNIEQVKKDEYSIALRRKQSSALKSACLTGSTAGLAQLVQLWGMALMFWSGGMLLSTYPGVWEFRDFLIALFAILISVSGTTLGSSGTTDKKVAEEAASRIFALIDRHSSIDPLSDTGKKGNEAMLS